MKFIDWNVWNIYALVILRQSVVKPTPCTNKLENNKQVFYLFSKPASKSHIIAQCWFYCQFIAKFD